MYVVLHGVTYIRLNAANRDLIYQVRHLAQTNVSAAKDTTPNRPFNLSTILMEILWHQQ